MVGAPGPVPYTSGYTVHDYILLAGGFDEVHADKNAVYLVDENDVRTRVGITDVVPGGSHIQVDPKLIYTADETVKTVFIATAWVTSIISVITTVYNFLVKVGIL